MFGHQDDAAINQIPENSIDEALKAVSSDSSDNNTNNEWQHPGEPIVTSNETVADLVADEGTSLVDIKQKALKELSPLVAHLDQSPEEKFKITMMLIQASDDRDLIPKAYEIAQQISDNGKRAQALLDVVNEINYFTQASKQ